MKRDLQGQQKCLSWFCLSQGMDSEIRVAHAGSAYLLLHARTVSRFLDPSRANRTSQEQKNINNVVINHGFLGPSTFALLRSCAVN